jgi:hypothetical protein
MVNQTHIADVMRKYPDLTIDGLAGDRRPDFEGRRMALIGAVREFDRAVAWLSRVPKRRSPNRDDGHSYGLKHAAETWAGAYLPNGVLITNLWDHCGPSSKKILRVGLDADFDEILSNIRQHIESIIVHYRIPENLEKRFEWLSAGDVHVKQDLLGHLRQREKSLVVEGAKLQLPIMLSHLRGEQGQNTHRLAHILKIGRHELEVTLVRNFSGVALIDPPTPSSSHWTSSSPTRATSDYRWVWWIIGIAFFLFMITRK